MYLNLFPPYYNSLSTLINLNEIARPARIATPRSQNRNISSKHLSPQTLREVSIDQSRRTGQYIGNVNPRGRSDGFARWSDYISDDTEDYFIPRQSTESTFSEIRKESTSQYDPNDNTKLPETNNQRQSGQRRKSSQNVAKNRESMVSKDQKQRMSTKQGPQQNGPKTSTSNKNSQRLDTQQKQVPFQVPEISNIKERKSVGRRSEQLLLDLLKSQNAKLEEQKRRRSEKEEKQVEQKKKQPQIKVEQKMDIVESTSTRILQNKKPEEFKHRLQSKYCPQQLGPISEKIEQQSKSNRIKSRVTFNDKGKIKHTTDSFSADFDFILPASLRKEEDSQNYHRIGRSQTIEENQEEEGDEKEKQQEREPMDIITQAQKVEDKEQQYVKQEEEEKWSKLYSPKLKIKNSKRQKQVRVKPNVTQKSKNIKTTKQAATSKQSKQSTSQNARQDKSRPKVNKQRSKVSSSDNKHQSKQLKRLQNHRKKKRNVQGIQITQEHLQQSAPANTRPTRTRTVPLQYWNNEKPIYNARGERVLQSNIEPKDFMEMVGFSHPGRIQAHFINCSLKEVVYRVTLKPGQHLYSSGINYYKMKESFQKPEQFDTLVLSSQQLRQGFIQVVVDDLDEKLLSGDRVIEREQTFQVKNTSDTKTFTIILSLVNSSKSK